MRSDSPWVSKSGYCEGRAAGKLVATVLRGLAIVLSSTGSLTTTYVRLRLGGRVSLKTRLLLYQIDKKVIDYPILCSMSAKANVASPFAISLTAPPLANETEIALVFAFQAFP